MVVIKSEFERLTLGQVNMKKMPIEIHELDFGLGCEIKAKHELLNEEPSTQILEHMSKILDINEKYIYLIIDCSQIKLPEVNFEDMHKAVQQAIQDYKYNPDLVVAINVNDDVTFRLANMWSLFVKDIGWEVDVFRKKDLLDEWIQKEMQKRYDLTKLTFR